MVLPLASWSNTEKSAMLSSPSENRLVSVISYQEPGKDCKSIGWSPSINLENHFIPDLEVTKGLNKDEVLG